MFTNDKINDKINGKIKSIDNEIIKMLKDNAYMTIPELAAKVQKSEATVHRHLNSLSDMEIIKRVGSRKTGYWKVKEES